ncbi:VWA domain-containing protein [Nocardioides ochotonae]|uniref:VWA domain-containing protein n=1 Tax=Nocardioides ochotonae TaxID=2685869 RepID=UPI0014096BA5|nr:VWA domain-containing protein [Nocardioides ochotonae]
MALIQWWVGALVLMLGLAVGLTAWWWHRLRRRGDGVAVAGLERVRALPAFRALVRREVRARRLEVLSLVLALAGAALMAARLVGVSDESEQMRTRDVVLCMDVSGSMAPVVTDVLDTYLSLVAELSEERIGFVMFDGNAVTGFPLTDDYDFVVRGLRDARVAVEAGPVPGTEAPRSGSSLVGDGLASCVQHFDRPEDQRARTVVLATDNLVSGDAIYTLAQATELAVQSEAMVFGVVPDHNRAEATAELRSQTRRTHGDVLVVDAGDDANTVVIARAVERQEKKAILAAARDHSFDRVEPGGLMLVVGLLGAWTSRRRG